MEKYWSKRFDFPPEVTATDAASSDEESDNNSTNARPTASNHIASDNDDDETPDVAYARFRAQKAVQKSGHSGWEAEFRSWKKNFSPKHTPEMDLCKYWAVRAHLIHVFSS